MSPYQMHKPRNIKEAVDVITNLEDAQYVSGGTKLMPLIAKGLITPKHLISLQDIPDIKNVTKLNGVRLGSGLTLAQVGHNDLVRNRYTAIYDAVCALTLSRKDNKGTLGGDLCSAYPFASMACPLLIFDAEVAAAGMYPATHSEGMGVKGGFFGSRIIRIDSFFVARDSTILKKDELVKEFILPFLPEYTGSVFIRIKKGRSAYLGITGIGARITVASQDGFAESRKAIRGRENLSTILEKFADGSLMCMDVRLAVDYAGGLPQRLRNGEDALKGNIVSTNVLQGAIGAAAGEIMSSTRGKAETWYLQELVRVLLTRSVMMAIERAILPEENVRPERAW